jgi:hypothetical protein
VLLLIGGILLIVRPIWGAGYPWGSDTWGHLDRAQYMGDMIRLHGLADGFVKSAWMPDWYLGDPMRVYYPPLALWVLGPLTALTNNVFLAYRMLVTAILFLLGVSVYIVGVRWGQNRWLAMVGGLLAVMAPYTLRTVFSEGNLSRGVAILFFPWIVWFVEKLIKDKLTHGSFALLSFLWAGALVAHVMQAAIFAVAIGFYVALRLLGDVYIPLRRGVLALSTVAVGLLLASFYLIPAYSQLELVGVPSLPADKINLFSITLDALLPNHLSIEAASVGIVSIGVALIVCFRAKAAQHLALVVTSLACILLAFGPAGVMFEFIPLKESLLPERFLNASAILIPLIIATTSPLRLKPIVLVLGVVLITFVEYLPASRVIMMRDAPPDETAIASALAEGTLAGRVAPLTLPNPTASQIFLQNHLGNHANVSGWALENTPQQDAVRRLLAATTQAPDYLTRVLSLWNVDYVVTRATNDNNAGAFGRYMPYQAMASVDNLLLWERSEATSFTQLLPENRMLIIGDNATSWLYAFPFASEGEFADPSDYSDAYLDHYSVIGLNRVSQDSDIEATLNAWVREGNTLITDLSGLGNINEMGYSVFGVHAIPLALNDRPQIHWSRELTTLNDSLSILPIDEGWRGATYRGLDTTLATVTYQGEEYPLLGYRNLGAGRVWFVGFNLLYALEIAERFGERDLIVDYLLADTGVNRDLELPSFVVNGLERASDRIAFQYRADSPASVILSMTYFPRWHATLDGSPLGVDSHEHLILLELPAGEHTLTLTYHPYSSVSFVGFAVSACSLLALGIVTYRLRNRPLKARVDREGNFEDRLPQPVPAPEPELREGVCPDCGYAHAVIGPPTAETYPFMSIECPSCGFKLSKLE